MTPAFAFLHVGAAVALPRLLVRSIRALHPHAEIVQCTDEETPAIEGVDDVRRLDGAVGGLMTFRLASFAALARRGATMYMDTDMLCIRPLDPAAELGS